MSAITNNNWYNLNSTRKYPLDEGATGIDDNGIVMPATIITDINIRLPMSLGLGGMLSGLVVTNNLVSATFLATNQPAVEYFTSEVSSSAAAESFTPLCSVSLVKPVEIGVPYPLVPFADGVAGWIVFGEGINKTYNGKFSTLRQSTLAPKVCRYYRNYPVTSIGKKDSTTELTGLVQLVAGRDVSIELGEREIEGEVKKAIVFSLKDRTNQNSLQLYTSKCSGRPESKTCDKESVEFINSVGPDCQGNLNIVFEEPFRTANYPNNIGGIALDYPIGLIDACVTKDNLPDSTGRLPTDYTNDDQCNPSSLSDPDANTQPRPPVLPPPVEVSSSTINMIELPASVFFNAESPAYWQTMLGQFNYVTDIVPLTNEDGTTSLGYSEGLTEGTLVIDDSYAATGAANLNVSLWFNGDYSTTINKRIVLDLKLILVGGYGSGFMVLNYRPNAANTIDEFFAIEISKPTSSFSIRKFTGSGFVTLVMSGSLNIEQNSWYRIEVEVTPGISPSVTSMTARLYNRATMALMSTLTVGTSLYLPANGKVGIGSSRAEARFSFFSMEEIV